MIQLIATDIDGTLVKDGSPKVNPAYFKTITQLIDTGLSFCACSGRQFQSIHRMFAPIADKIYYITENGSVLRTNDKVLFKWHIPEAGYDHLIDDIRHLPDITPVVSTPDCTYVEGGEDNGAYHLLKDSYRYNVRAVSDVTAIDPEDIVKISLYHPVDVEKACGAFEHSKWEKSYRITCSGKYWIDMCSRSAGKGESFALLQVLLDIPKENTLYFGDNMNDLTAFTESGTAAAPATARKEVRREADMIVKSYDKLGVLKTLNHVLDERLKAAEESA